MNFEGIGCPDFLVQGEYTAFPKVLIRFLDAAILYYCNSLVTEIFFSRVKQKILFVDIYIDSH